MAVAEERAESAGMVSRTDLPPDPWRDLVAAFWELGTVFDEAGHSYDGLLAILAGKRSRSGPGPLCIDGREYRRRQKGRTKRKRRR